MSVSRTSTAGSRSSASARGRCVRCERGGRSTRAAAARRTRRPSVGAYTRVKCRAGRAPAGSTTKPTDESVIQRSASASQRRVTRAVEAIEQVARAGDAWVQESDERKEAARVHRVERRRIIEPRAPAHSGHSMPPAPRTRARRVDPGSAVTYGAPAHAFAASRGMDARSRTSARSSSRSLRRIRASRDSAACGVRPSEQHDAEER